jgi:hypothetical protein
MKKIQWLITPHHMSKTALQSIWIVEILGWAWFFKILNLAILVLEPFFSNSRTYKPGLKIKTIIPYTHSPQTEEWYKNRVFQQIKIEACIGMEFYD